MGAGGATVVADRVRSIVRAALVGAPGRWWDAEELAAQVEIHAPSLSADPLAVVRVVLRAALAEAEPWLAFDRQARPSARARYLGKGNRGVPVLVYRWGRVAPRGV